MPRKERYHILGSPLAARNGTYGPSRVGTGQFLKYEFTRDSPASGWCRHCWPASSRSPGGSRRLLLQCQQPQHRATPGRLQPAERRPLFGYLKNKYFKIIPVGRCTQILHRVTTWEPVPKEGRDLSKEDMAYKPGPNELSAALYLGTKGGY